jgi:predicted nuclease of predicted toxin-antitoxin system
MRVLLDTCVAAMARDALVEKAHDVVWGGDWEEDPGDAEILNRAFSERRILITLDKDFGELAVVQGLPHCGIVRLVGLTSREQGPACVGVFERYGAELAAAAIVTVERGRVRVRPGQAPPA